MKPEKSHIGLICRGGSEFACKFWRNLERINGASASNTSIANSRYSRDWRKSESEPRGLCNQSVNQSVYFA